MAGLGLVGGGVLLPPSAYADTDTAASASSAPGAVSLETGSREATAAELDSKIDVTDADQALAASETPAETSDQTSTEAPDEAPAEAPADTSRARTLARSAATDTPRTGTGGVAIGGTKNWYVLDAVRGSYVAYQFVLQALGEHIEVWVQTNLDFPAGDCRNDGVRNVVTRQQAETLAAEFDANILPKESAVFSTAPGRNGSKGQFPVQYGGDGDTTVALIANIRDADYYAPTTPAGATYIAGYFSPDLSEFFDRHLMTIDSYDWVHRTGVNPPETTATCLPRAPSPRLYEATFAHEYQHLLEYYVDRDETTWLNEGLSDYAQTLTGYVDPRIRYGSPGAEVKIACFQGFITTAATGCGAENSLTRWGDRGSTSLADYGASYSFVTYLADHYGTAAITALHRDPANGLASVQNYLTANATRGLSAADVVHDWAVAMAVDGWLDDGARGLVGSQPRRFQSDQLHSAVNWNWTGSYATPGAPPNGSDYVLAMGTAGSIGVRGIDSVVFRGGESFPAATGSPVKVNAWSVQLIGWSEDGQIVRVVDLPPNSRRQIKLDRCDLKVMLKGADRIGFVITADDPTEKATTYAPYELTVNGQRQLGGAPVPAATLKTPAEK